MFVLPQSWASPIAESAMTGLSLSPSQTQDPLGFREGISMKVRKCLWTPKPRF